MALMAVATHPLSSNWRKLQEKLQKQDGSAISTKDANRSLQTAVKPNLKRKHVSTEKQHNNHKRPKNILPANTTMTTPQSYATNPHSLPAVKPGKFIALDTEMVGTFSAVPHSLPPNRQPPHTYSLLARVSLVTYNLERLYDAYVLPPPDTPIDDYRTPFSGITAWHLDPANPTTKPKTLEIVQREVAELLEGRVLVGHDLAGDMAVLGLSHPRKDIRDTAMYPRFRLLAAGGATAAAGIGLSRREGGLGKKESVANVAARERGVPRGGKKPSLRMLSKELLGWDIQSGKGHDSIEDAQAVMAVYRGEREHFEQWIIGRFGVDAVRKKGPGQETKIKEAGVVAVPGASGDASIQNDDSSDTLPDNVRGFVPENEYLDHEQSNGEDSMGESMNPAKSGGPQKKRKKKKKKGRYRRG